MEILPWGSGSGTNIEAMHGGAGDKYRIVALFYDRPCRVPEIARTIDVPAITLTAKLSGETIETNNSGSIIIVV